jgi:Zn-dependent metalloprotease
MIGEELFIANVSGSANQSAIRYMFDPHKDGLSANCWSASIGTQDVHYSSGPANRFFYLLAVGTNAVGMPASATCVTGNTKNATGSGSLTGIGNAKAAAIWFRAVTTKMTSGTTYPGARTATLAAAAELYGAGSPEQNAVAAAWSAILVN